MTLLARQQIHTGILEKAYAAQIERAQKNKIIDQIIARNPAVFRKKQRIHQKIILNRLGWIDVIDEMPAEIERMEKLVRAVRQDGYRHLFVLGMGGSSLCPEVFGDIFGKKSWLKSYTIIDTTAPSQLEPIIKSTDFTKAFFIVSSKSGGTIETLSQFRYFFKLVKNLRPLKAGQHFAAITDDGSDLQRMARRNRFRELFLNRSDIGGRYSALSYFGLVPGAFTQLDLGALLSYANAQLSHMRENGNGCDALRLGTLMGTGAVNGIDKLRFRTTPALAPFIAWIEQLVAESTGKEMKGIVPIEGNIEDGAKTDDIIDVYYRARGERLDMSNDKNHPSVSIELEDPFGIGGEMVKWEMATAVSATILGVNPFDEPNVAESKKNTAIILHARRGPRKPVVITPLAEFGEIDIIAAAGIKGLERRRNATAEEVWRGFLSEVVHRDYLAFLCYCERNASVEKHLAALRRLVEQKYNIITLRGYGPRFLHSTGQLFKGGTQEGHFVVMEREYDTDYDIPGQNISFGRLIKAQAQGDIKAIHKRKRPVININLRMNPEKGLDSLVKLIESL